MDTLLDGPFLLVEDDSYIELPKNTEETSQWIVDKEYITPATSIKLQKKLLPGIYQVGVNNSIGLFCKKLSVKSDELYIFSNSIINNLLIEITNFLNNGKIFRDHKLLHKRGILLEGYPGTGKSSIISLLTKEVVKHNGIVFNVETPNNFNAYVEFLVNNFRKIEPETPVITILEDIDNYSDSTTILDFLDGKNSINHHIVIATTNNTKNLPDSFLRPSRLDLRIEIPLPNAATRKEFFMFKKVKEEDLEELVESTKDCSLADLKEIFITKYLLNYTISEAVEKVKKPRTRKNYNFSKKQNKKISI